LSNSNTIDVVVADTSMGGSARPDRSEVAQVGSGGGGVVVLPLTFDVEPPG